ncbi:hypothetical protein FA15DRAFT_587923 [Coprinopsis marcescibilis]|uniref:Acyl-CoA desaturase n=1 Tax=Coprinopsis marcescibilis TaxID=230819 RepID=A0A5C3L0Z9_COPMA|nr:hypothetical protein FA15DRAFT_587923 [Coprinopsis marcescibilis]
MHSSKAQQVSGARPEGTRIWWSNAVFFVCVHMAAFMGVYYRPPWLVKPASLVLGFLVWQLADFGITIGYHRLYSHKAFRATTGVRIMLAMLGSVAFQGSIKWWCLRHRLHHRYTDDPIHDPYAATRGLLYSHMGWIFFKRNYERLSLIEKDDLERDPVVQFQHKYYVFLALILGFAMPPLLGLLWNDPLGSFIWAGLVSRLFIWHCTFLVNSLAHKNGLQPYSDEDSSRGNLILALLTGGEGNHNFHHSFPNDFRSGPFKLDWDPSKWIILALYRMGLVSGLRTAREVDIVDCLLYTQKKRDSIDAATERWEGVIWDHAQLRRYHQENPLNCILLLDGFVLDVTQYIREHPGGSALLKNYSFSIDKTRGFKGVQWEFHGGFNNHSRTAKKRAREMRIAKLDGTCI